MGVIASFDYGTFTTLFPEFSSLDATLANSYFTRAGLIHANDGSGPVRDANTQALLMNLMTAHIAQLNKLQNGQAVSELVGRIDNANEGSVSVSATFDVPPGVPQYYAQTKYGVEYWAATAQYRTMRYRRAPSRSFEPPFGGGRGLQPWW